ncbi:hypothetical protein V1517DRAFT_318295 [Lipomyces orientalis]|uniref:Uncharacterized protein n=1 Tax=Lipomyces orientalis TaxID=1233043 RepID=A0ACC3TSY1_9ASCO
MSISNRSRKPQIHAIATDSSLAFLATVASALTTMSAHLPVSCPAGIIDGPESGSRPPHSRLNDRKSSSLSPPPVSRHMNASSDRRSSMPPRHQRPESARSSTTTSMLSSRSSSSSSVSRRSDISRSSSSTQVPSRAGTPESYILATPPPRPGYSQAQLIFQIQRLTSRHVLPVLNVKRPVTSPAPVAAFHKKAAILPKKLSSSQFVVYSCDDIDHDTHTSILHASGHDLKFGYSSGLTWRVRTDGAGPGVLVIAVSERDGSRKTLGRWTPSNAGPAGILPTSANSGYGSGETSWHFVAKGEVLATLRGNRVDITSAAAEISRKGYLGRLRFEEAIVLSSVYIENMHTFGRPPQVESDHRRLSDDQVPSSSCSLLPSPPAPAFASKKIEKHASMPTAHTASELQKLSRLGGSLLRRGRTLLLRKHSTIDSRKTAVA